ncbi:amino acid transporter [Malaciobacter pacificus]|uniref:Amino acid permease n=1 Tax=Malaciobacter pacificus TaxID=1080223 RepID=A0A5C2H5U8_9BACT|nr:APC family permease [Malaciobacter pacificus]QEP34327.1 amino acid permease [Malaciobacter pacificus]GGD49962.1 amino acid transporter [Malaciobacter pacificus]
MNKIHRNRDKSLGLLELIAIALGGMVGGGIFTILGVSVSMIGVYTPLAILFGGVIAGFASYSYIKLGVYYKDEGASYSFIKRTYPNSKFEASLIGWWVIFGYISTIALYSYTFSSYATSTFDTSELVRKLVAGLIILVFVFINVWSVKGMGKLEDLMVYTKLLILIVISFVLINNSQTTLPVLIENNSEVSLGAILIVSSITFVAYEGFQLVINAVNEMDNPSKNIPKAIYSAIGLAILIYVIIALGAILAISFEDIIANEEYALAAGANKVLGHWGNDLVIFGALLATSSAISSTVFGASRQMAIIANDGLFPRFLRKRNEHNIPVNAIWTMSILAFILVLSGSLTLILEFGSITFLIVSLIMAIANFKIKDETKSSTIVLIISIFVLALSTFFIIYYEYVNAIEQLYFIVFIYLILTIASYYYSKKSKLEENL